VIRRLAHRVLLLAAWSVLGVLAGLFLWVSVPYLFGQRSLTVLSGSMEPQLHVGTSSSSTRSRRSRSASATS